MSKRGENIYKRKDGRWEGRYIKERSADGKARYAYVYGKSYADAKQKLLDRRIAQAQNIDCSPSHTKYGDIGPLAELDRPVIVDLESNRNDHLQIVVLHLAANLTGALSLNYPEIPDSCLLCQLTILIDLLDVLIDCPNIHIIESRHHLLGQPDILILIAHFHALCTVTGSGHKGQVFRCAGSDRLFLFTTISVITCVGT